MSDLALEIKKLADKYRNSKGIHGSEQSNEDFAVDDAVSAPRTIMAYNTQNSAARISTSVFDDRDSDLLDEDSPEFEDFIDEDDFGGGEEIQIADFINPKIDVAYGVEPEEEVLHGDRKTVSENLRNISRDLRNLKALLRT